MRSTHSQSNNTNDDDQDSNEGDDATHDSNNQSVIVTHRLLHCWHFRFNLCSLGDRNTPNDVRLLSCWSGQNSR